MSFKITILGAASAKPTANLHPSAQVVNFQEQYYLVDAGEGVQQQLFRYGVNPLKLRAVFISHLHGDHLYGLFPLLSTLSLYGRQTALTIYAPDPFGRILEHYMDDFGGELSYPIEWQRVDTTAHQMIFENRSLEVWSIPLRHRVPTSGYLFREKQPPLNVDKFKIERYNLSIAQIASAKRGEDVTLEDGEVIANHKITYTPYQARSYGYLSDTNYSAKAANLCKGASLIYHEATYATSEKREAKERGHSTAAQAAQAATLAEAKGLIIGHFSSRYKDTNLLLNQAKEIFENTQLAIEGNTYTIEKER